MTSQDDTPTISSWPSDPPPRGFSEGMERMPHARSSSRVGRFSDAIARSPGSASAKRIGSFADGLARRPNQRSARRVGSFGDGLARADVYRATLRRVDSPRRPVEDQRAA
jgi:hypothetical protein